MAKNGDWRWIMNRAKIAARDANGKPLRLVGIYKDITGRKQGEVALRESEDKYRHILENLQDAYLRMNRDWVLTMVNPSAARIYGYRSPDEMIEYRSRPCSAILRRWTGSKNS
jgi:PAS domain-containing protein